MRRLAGDESGFTMIAIVTGMMVISMFSLGAYAAANGDITIGRKDQDRKRALEASKAGIEWYTYHLFRNPNYWTGCDDPASVAATGISLQGANRPPANWRALPASDEEFQVELMSANGSALTRTACLANPGGTLLNGGVLKIRSTGRSRGQTRQLVATYRRTTFLDYLWYTNRETGPPQVQPTSEAWAETNCSKPRSIRKNLADVNGQKCQSIRFPTGDVMGGPMHTEDDSFLVCDTPIFGRGVLDNLEVALAASPAAAYTPDTNCSNAPLKKGTTIAPAKSLGLPPDNQGLVNAATYPLSGQSCATFNSDGTVTLRQGMTWSQTDTSAATAIDCDTGGTAATYTLGPDTVIYAKNSAAGCAAGGYKRYQRYEPNHPGCGDIAVRGTYTGNVTVGAQNDIVVRSDLQQSTNNSPMMGLIANNYVRIYHPAIADRDDDGDSVLDCQDGGRIGTSNLIAPYNFANTSRLQRVDAAILALNGAFIVDNWDCGNKLGTLTVNGNIAQRWRGAVGSGGCTSGSGYCKDYKYDDRLKYRQPPAYLDPVQARWHMLRQSEQSPVQ